MTSTSLFYNSEIIGYHVRSFISDVRNVKLTHYVENIEFISFEEKNHFSEIILNQSCSPALDKNEHQG